MITKVVILIWSLYLIKEIVSGYNEWSRMNSASTCSSFLPDFWCHAHLQVWHNKRCVCQPHPLPWPNQTHHQHQQTAAVAVAVGVVDGDGVWVGDGVEVEVTLVILMIFHGKLHARLFNPNMMYPAPSSFLHPIPTPDPRQLTVLQPIPIPLIVRVR